MNQGKPTHARTVKNLRLQPPQPILVAAEPATRSRHAAITHDLYSYRRYKNWMNNLRATWDKT